MPTTTTGGLTSGDGELGGLRLSHAVVIVLHLQFDLCVDATHATSTRTGLGFLDEKGEHGGTVTEFVEGLVFREDGASQNHALLAPLHFLWRHLDGEHVPVVGHDVTVRQDLMRKLSVTCVRSGK